MDTTTDALTQDVRRYRFLRAWSECRSLHMDGTASWRVRLPAGICPRAPSLDAAIDAYLHLHTEESLHGHRDVT